MSQQPSSQQPGWRVVQQIETIGQRADGQYVPGVRVSFEVTPSGSQASVFVPTAEYTPERVAQLVTERARQLVGVSGLSGRL